MASSTRWCCTSRWWRSTPPLARRVAKRAPLAVAATKWTLNKAAGGHYREGENLMPAIFASQDVAEGRAAFEERREPVFRGN